MVKIQVPLAELPNIKFEASLRYETTIMGHNAPTTAVKGMLKKMQNLKPTMVLCEPLMMSFMRHELGQSANSKWVESVFRASKQDFRDKNAIFYIRKRKEDTKLHRKIEEAITKVTGAGGTVVVVYFNADEWCQAAPESYRIRIREVADGN